LSSNTCTLTNGDSHEASVKLHQDEATMAVQARRHDPAVKVLAFKITADFTIRRQVNHGDLSPGFNVQSPLKAGAIISTSESCTRRQMDECETRAQRSGGGLLTRTDCSSHSAPGR